MNRKRDRKRERKRMNKGIDFFLFRNITDQAMSLAETYGRRADMILVKIIARSWCI